MSRKPNDSDESESKRNAFMDSIPDEAVKTSDLPDDDSAEHDESSQGDSAAASETDSDGSNDSDSAAEATKQAKRKRGSAKRRITNLQKRLSEATNELGSSKSQIQQLRAELAEARAQAADVPEPDIKDFGTPQEYAKAHTKWSNAKHQASKPPKQTQQRQPKPEDVPATPPAAINAWLDDGKERIGAAFEDALASQEVAISATMADVIVEQEFGPEIYVYLADNPELSVDMAKMPVSKMVREIGKLEKLAAAGKLELEVDDYTPPAKKKPAQRSTQAGDPPSDTRDGGSGSVKPDPENESMDDYAARRRKERAARGGRY